MFWNHADVFGNKNVDSKNVAPVSAEDASKQPTGQALRKAVTQTWLINCKPSEEPRIFPRFMQEPSEKVVYGYRAERRSHQSISASRLTEMFRPNFDGGTFHKDPYSPQTCYTSAGNTVVPVALHQFINRDKPELPAGKPLSSWQKMVSKIKQSADKID